MKGRHIFVPIGGVNSDDSNETIDSNDFRTSRDLEIGFQSNGNANVAKGTRGKKRVLPMIAGVFETLGSVQDVASDTLLALVWAGSGNHQIRRIGKDGTQVILIESSALGFSRELITTADVIGDMITFTQPGQPPKAFLISKAEKFYQSGGTDPEGYSGFTADMILAGALPAKYSPKFEYERVFDGTPTGLLKTKGTPSLITDRAFQFSYYYIYDDETHSAPSPISKLAYPFDNTSEHGSYPLGYDLRAVRVFFNTGISTVKKIVVLVREGNYGAWLELSPVDKLIKGYGNDQEESVMFFGNAAGIYSRTFMNYHYIPVTAKYQAYLSDGNMAYANYEAGHDKVVADISLQLKGKVLENALPYDLKMVNKIINRTTNPGGTTSLSEAGVAVVFQTPIGNAGAVVSIEFTWMVKPTTTGYSKPSLTFPNSGSVWSTPDLIGYKRTFVLNLRVPDVDAIDVLEYKMMLVDEIVSQWEAWTRDVGVAVYIDYDDSTNKNIVPGKPKEFIAADCQGLTETDPTIFDGAFLVMYFPGLMVEMDNATHIATTGYAPPSEGGFDFSDPDYIVQTLTDKTSLPKTVKSYKRGSLNLFALNYYDEFNRDNSCIVDVSGDVDLFRVEVPEWLYYPTNAIPGLENSIDANGRYKLFVEATINHRPPAFATHYQWVVAESVNLASYGLFRVTAMNKTEKWFSVATGGDASVKSTKNFGHAITEGDFIRATTYDYELYSKIKSKVTGFDEVKIYYQDTEGMKLIGVGAILEIFTPSKIDGDNLIYHEIGMEFPILNPRTDERMHGGGVQVQTADDPAISILESESNYNRDRITEWKENETDLNSIYYRNWIEDRRFSDWQTIPAGDRGRVAVYDANAKKKRYDNVYHGGKYFKDTPINDLWVMSSGGEKTMSASKGEITGLVSVGYTLKVFQMRGLTSIYIGRVSAMNADGTENVIGLSNEVFGTVNPSSSPYGCQNPESIVSTKRHVYFFDRAMKAWCRDAPNGVVAISDYKAKTLWAEITDQSLSDAKFFSSFKEDEKMLVVSVWDTETDKRISHVFLETENRWKGTFQFNVGIMGMIGPDIVGFETNANAFLLWRDAVGVNMSEYTPMLKIVVNGDYAIAKVLDFLTIQTNMAWSVTDIVCPAEVSGANREMRSRIVPERFNRLEDKYHAYVGGDMNTPGMTESQGVVNGDEMRGQAFIVTLVAPDRKFNVRLAHVLAGFTHSMNTP